MKRVVSHLYKEFFSRGSTDFLTSCADRIEALRPKSLPPRGDHLFPVCQTHFIHIDSELKFTFYFFIHMEHK